MAKNDNSKALAIAIAKVAKKIVPELAELTKGTEFTLTILDDGEGFGMIVEVENNPEIASLLLAGSTVGPKVEDIAENVQIDVEEADRIRKALELSNWNKRIAADKLGLSERSLFRKMKAYKISKPKSK